MDSERYKKKYKAIIILCVEYYTIFLMPIFLFYHHGIAKEGKFNPKL